MAKPKKEPAPQPDDSLIIETGEQIDDALSAMLAEAGDIEAKAHVYLIDEKTGEDAKIWSGPPADYDLDVLAKRHGSGRYRLKVYVKTDAGNFGLRINRVFPYRLSAEEDARLRAIRSGEMAPPGQAQAPFNPESLVTAIVAGIRAAIPAPAAPANNLGMLKEVAEIVRTLAPQPMVQAQPAFNPIDIFRAASELAADRDPIERGVNASGTDIFMRLIDRFGPAFERAMQLPPQGALAAPAAPVGAQSAPTPPQQPSPENEAVIKLRMGLSFLVAQAEAGNEPETYADVVLDNVPEEDLKKFLANPDPVGYLANLVPEIAKHRAWFDKLIAEVREALKDEAVDEPQRAS